MKNIIAIFVALIFFALIATIFVFAASISINVVYALIILVVVGAVYVGTGGRAWFGTHEHPDSVLGDSVRFAEVDGLGACPPIFPNAVIRAFEEGSYRAEFINPLENEMIKENFVDLWPRHKGYQISRISKRGILAVNARIWTTLHSFACKGQLASRLIREIT